MRNCRQRIGVGCTAEGCNFYICVRGHLQIDGMIVKEFRSEHVHNVGEQCQMGRWEKRMMRAKLLSRLIEGKVRSSMDYLPTKIMKDLELKLGIRMTYIVAGARVCSAISHGEASGPLQASPLDVCCHRKRKS